jgi:hypothetical protein
MDGARSDHSCDPFGRPEDEAEVSPYAAAVVEEDPVTSGSGEMSSRCYQ